MKSELTIARLSGFGRGQDQHFAQDVVTLGTDPGCDVRFDAAWDKTASARHATLRRDGRGGWRLEDTSRDGCWVDGRRLPTRHAIDPGETVLEIGKGGPRLKLTYMADEPAAALVPTAQAVLAPPQAAHVYAPPPPPAYAPAVPPVRTLAPEPGAPARSNRGLLMAIAALLVLAIMGGVFVLARRVSPVPVPAGTPEPARSADELLAGVAEKYEDAVGEVVNAGFVRSDGLAFDPAPQATAWAIGEHVFATNSHVSQPTAEELAKGRTVFIAINHHPERRYRVTRAVVHPRYGKPLVNFEGRPPAVDAYDVGLLYVDETVPNRFPVAPDSELRKLASGYRVGYVGFPTEKLQGGGVDFRNPVAIMQSGILTSVTDYWLSRADFANAQLLEHNLGATGGASGSPLFNARGEVVGILSAVNFIFQHDPKTGATTARLPSGVLVNFAQRVDLLKDIYPDYGK